MFRRKDVKIFNVPDWSDTTTKTYDLSTVAGREQVPINLDEIKDVCFIYVRDNNEYYRLISDTTSGSTRTLVFNGSNIITITKTSTVMTVEFSGIGSSSIQDSSVTSAKLATNSVTSDKIENGAITTPKLSQNLKDTIVPLSKFTGNTDGERLYTALFTDGFRGTILGGNITVDSTITIPKATIREVKISNAIITLNSDMFTTLANFARLPSFINCKFIGNGYSIFAGDYGVYGEFLNCSFVNCSLMNNTNGKLQSPFVSHCEILNSTVPFIKARSIYACYIVSTICEAQAAKFIDTSDSTDEDGGPQNLWVENSLFEGFQNTVFDLYGSRPSVYIKNCYFEANAGGCVHLTKSSDGYDILLFEVSGCKINSAVTPFTISGFTDNYRVKISIHDNYYHTTVESTPMVTGIPVDNLFTVYNNRPTATTTIISDTARLLYEPGIIERPTLDTTIIKLTSGGFVQFGRIVFVDMTIQALVTQAGTISNIITNFPKVSTANTRISITTLTDESTNKELYITGTTSTLYNGITLDERYRIRGFYFTDKKTVR